MSCHRDTIPNPNPNPYPNSQLMETEAFEGFHVPKGTSIHMHIFSLHNSPSVWGSDVSRYDPTRWLDQNETECDNDNNNSTNKCRRPTCPFNFGTVEEANKLNREDPLLEYSGLGFTEGALSFMPFSAGLRSCPAKALVLQVCNAVLYTISSPLITQV